MRIQERARVHHSLSKMPLVYKEIIILCIIHTRWCPWRPQLPDGYICVSEGKLCARLNEYIVSDLGGHTPQSTHALDRPPTPPAPKHAPDPPSGRRIMGMRCPLSRDYERIWPAYGRPTTTTATAGRLPPRFVCELWQFYTVPYRLHNVYKESFL